MAKVIIRDILRSKGISNKELARLLGVTPSAVSQLLANPNPTVQQIERIADVINVDFVEMFSEKHEFVNGFVEVGKEIYPIKNREQFFDVMNKISGIVHILSYPEKSMYHISIREILKLAILENKSSSLTYRYGVNQIITLSFDEVSRNVFLTQCIGDGNGKLTIFDTKKYIKSKNDVIYEEMDNLTKDIMSQVESAENNIEEK